MDRKIIQFHVIQDRTPVFETPIEDLGNDVIIYGLCNYGNMWVWCGPNEKDSAISGWCCIDVPALSDGELTKEFKRAPYSAGVHLKEVGGNEIPST